MAQMINYRVVRKTERSAADKKELFLHYLRTVAPDLPLPDESEYYFAKPRRWRADFMYRSQPAAGPGGPGLLIEIDGGQWSFAGGRHARDGDRSKGNRAASQGWLVMHISPQMLEQAPQATLDDVRAALLLIGRAESTGGDTR